MKVTLHLQKDWIQKFQFRPVVPQVLVLEPRPNPNFSPCQMGLDPAWPYLLNIDIILYLWYRV
jgi:hypothetical protein